MKMTFEERAAIWRKVAGRPLIEGSTADSFSLALLEALKIPSIPEEPLRALCGACNGFRCPLCRNTGYELGSGGQRVLKVGVIVADHPVHGWHMHPCVNWEDIGEGTFLYAAVQNGVKHEDSA